MAYENHNHPAPDGYVHGLGLLQCVARAHTAGQQGGYKCLLLPPSVGRVSPFFLTSAVLYDSLWAATPDPSPLSLLPRERDAWGWAVAGFQGRRRGVLAASCKFWSSPQPCGRPPVELKDSELMVCSDNRNVGLLNLAV